MVKVLAILSLVLLLVGYTLRNFNTNKYKKLDVSIDGILGTSLFRFIVARFSPEPDTKKYYLTISRLSVLPIKVTLEKFYAFKGLVAIVVFLFTLGVFVTNYDFEKTSIIKNTKNLGTQLQPSQMLNSISLDSQNLLQYYNLVNDRLKLSAELKLPKEQAIGDISNVLSTNTDLSASNVTILAPIILSKAEQVEGLFNYASLSLLLASLMGGFIAPTLVLNLYYKSRQKAYNQEVYNLETLVLLLGSMDNVSVRVIIQTLVDNAILFKPLLKKFYSIYCVNRQNAYEYAQKSSVNTELERLIASLRRCEQSNKSASIEAVSRKRNSKKDFSKLERETQLERRDLACLVLYFVVFILLIAVFITPWTSQMSMLQAF